MEDSMTNSGYGPSEMALPTGPAEPDTTGAPTNGRTHPAADAVDTAPVAVVADGSSNGGADGPAGESDPDGDGTDTDPVNGAPRKRRRGSRGGQRRRKPAGASGDGATDGDDDSDLDDDSGEAIDAGAESDPATAQRTAAPRRAAANRAPRPSAEPGADQSADADNDTDAGSDADGDLSDTPVAAARRGGARRVDALDPDLPELPERPIEGRISDPEIAAKVLVPRRPQVGDTLTPPPPPPPGKATAKVPPPAKANGRGGPKGDRANGSDRSGRQAEAKADSKSDAKPDEGSASRDAGADGSARTRKKRPARAKKTPEFVALDSDSVVERKKGRERNGRPIGRYLMAVQVRDNLTQVAVLEGRSLIEHYVSRPSDDIGQIHGNIYLGRVQNILPGMEAAFVDIATPKNAVLYRGDVQYDSEDLLDSPGNKKKNELRIEQMLKAKQLIVCQVTKNPIGAKGARLTQDVSLPGRFVVLIPNSSTFGISKRLPDDERRRLRGILDRVKPAEHGLIVRTAAESASEDELRADVLRLSATWNEIAAKAEQARKSGRPTLLYREPPLAVRVIREEFNAEYRNVVIDDRELYEEISGYVSALNPELADRVQYYDAAVEGLPLYERNHIHEQVHKALDRKVWLPSGGSLIIEHTEALTVIDVNTGKNVGSTNLEETVFHNNLEAADEIARQLRLRDIGGIIVIDFIDMEIKDNRRKVVDAFRSSLSRDKTRTQVFDISELGLVEMTRKRIGEGLLTSFADQCPNCEGRGVMIDLRLLE